mmetsp:Transcript_28645/g.27643  ORF Transcript_28645/g.27643 Transcript_28645/m.27643 type:complete len:140 (+) Transcript_28645:82-501(+)
MDKLEKVDLILQFEDHSLHYLQKNLQNVMWVREEGLASIQQLEVLDSESIHIETDLAYVKNIKQQEVPLGSIPERILTRYHENLRFILYKVVNLVNQVKSIDVQGIKKSITSPYLYEQFGFQKFFVALTDSGKVIAFSA